MPADNRVTSVSEFEGVLPGDVFATQGEGLVGSLIRRGTASPYAHVGVVAGVDVGTGDLVTHEAKGRPDFWKPGLRVYRRKPDGSEFAAVLRFWRDEGERQAIIAMSQELVDTKPSYGWGELALIALAAVVPHTWIPKEDRGSGMICSHHVAECLQKARPEDYIGFIRFAPYRMWPGGLLFDTQRMLWSDQHKGPS